MARIIMNPKVAENVVSLDMDAPGGTDLIRKHYEDGDVVILKDKRLDLDYKFLNSLNFNIDASPEILKRVKKFTHGKIMGLKPGSKDETGRALFEQTFQGDPGRLQAYKEQVEYGNKQLFDIYKKIFPKYEDYKLAYTWRFTETIFENLHWDNIGIDDDYQQVRIFVNVDSAPRIWHVSHKIDEYAKANYEKENLGRWKKLVPDSFNSKVNNEILGGMARPLLDGLEVHHIAFEQGEIWLAETRIASHQIYSGRQAIACMYYIKHESMDNPSKRFNKRVENVHKLNSDNVLVRTASKISNAVSGR